MNLFLDSNIIIGIIFAFNSIHRYSKELFEYEDNYFYSINVKDEVDEVFDRKNEEFENFIREIIYHLQEFRNDQIISNSKIHKIINKIGKIGKLELENMHLGFDKIWEEFGFGENQENFFILSKLNKFLKELYSKHDELKTRLCELMKLIPNHKSKNKEVLKIIERKNLRLLLHENDEEILFDLNEYAKNHLELDFCLVSWDDGFIDAVRILLDELSFKRYIGRKHQMT